MEEPGGLYSCLDNPTDGGAWWAIVTVHGVAKSRTRLSDFTFHFLDQPRWGTETELERYLTVKKFSPKTFLPFKTLKYSSFIIFC